MEQARKLWILEDQKRYFSIPRRLKELVYSLAVFWDEDNILRVKGRFQLQNSESNNKYPILLAKTVI